MNPEQATPQPQKRTYYRLYAKFSGQSKFKAMDLFEGTQVDNLIYATILRQGEALKVLQELQLAYPKAQFRIKEIPSQTPANDILDSII